MRANTARRRQPAWHQQREKLRRDGSMLRFKLGASLPQPHLVRIVGDVPVSPSSSIVADSVVSRGSLEETSKLQFDLDDNRDDNHNADPDDDEEALVSLNHSKKAPSFAKVCLGGLRGDPFDSFPIPNKGHVPGAFDFYTSVWYALSPQLPHHQTPEGRAQIARLYYTTMLGDEIFFEQCVAFSMLIQVVNRHCGYEDRLSTIVMRHTNNVLKGLRVRMTTDQGTSDATLLTIMCLAGVSIMVNDYKSFGIHCGAINNVVSLRGGYDSLGWNGFLKINALAIVGIHEARMQTLQQQSLLQSKYPVTKLERLKHPFPPDLCSTIAQLPPGFRELSLSTELSLQHIDALRSFVGWVQDIDRAPTQVMSTLIALPDFTQTTTLLVQVMIAYTFAVIGGDQLEPSQARLGKLHLQTTIAKLKAGGPLDNWDQHFVTWAYLILQSTTPDLEPESWRWAGRKLMAMEIDIARQEKLEVMFLPIPGRYDRGTFPSTRWTHYWKKKSGIPHGPGSPSNSNTSRASTP